MLARLRCVHVPACVEVSLFCFRLVAISLFLASACWAQIPQASDTTSTPVPDAGHDYLHSPLATVNPANGSVSIRIPVRIPAGRELTLGFGLAYDSNGVDYLGQPTGGAPGWTSAGSPLSVGGWSATGPMLTVGEFSFTVDAGIGLKHVQQAPVIFFKIRPVTVTTLTCLS